MSYLFFVFFSVEIFLYHNISVVGCGDLRIADVSFLPDPCGLPDKLKKRSLVEKERLIYAPFSGVGGVVYDKDAVYVDLGGSHSHSHKVSVSDFSLRNLLPVVHCSVSYFVFFQNDDEDRQAQRELVSTMLQTQETLDEKMRHSELQLFSNAKPITGDQLEQ